MADYKTAKEIRDSKPREKKVYAKPTVVDATMSDFMRYAERKNFQTSARKEVWKGLDGVSAPLGIDAFCDASERERFAREFEEATKQREAAKIAHAAASVALTRRIHSNGKKS